VSGTRKGARIRAAAAEIVDAVVSAGRSLDAALAEYEGKVAADDRALLRLLCFGTLRYHWRLQSWIDQLINKPLRERDSVINSLLAIGLYQLTGTRIPDHAVVSQTVEASRLLRRPKLAGLLNAVLRRFVREDTASNEPESAEAAHNHPQWLIDAITADWPDDADEILSANNTRAPMWLRVNSSRESAATYAARLEAEGIANEYADAIPGAVRLEEPVGVDDLPGFREGAASVQDGAAQLAAPWLLEGKRGRVLDACAAPGGKSGHLLELGGPEIALTCVERDKDRLQAIPDNLQRLGLDAAATLVCGDASTPETWWDGEPFGAILLDAPCSASGVIRRHPDIKMLRRETDIARLAGEQRALLDSLWRVLAPGGRLLYVTCSILAAENDRVVAPFLEATPDAQENDVLQNNNIRDVMHRKACGFQLLPGTAGLDGFYYACLERAA
jgi:16S rRNA (cytosine967-C5)-methyltransferase